ncbi:MAG: dihydroorotate dehydrogenase electron transfer subunit [Syntrophobacteraceae bacterium]
MSKIKEDALIISQTREAAGTFRMRLKSPRIAAEARPGQFVMLQVREGPEPLLRRPFSFHAITPDEGVFDILYRVVGRGTWMLSQCAPGSSLNILGPLGNGFDIPDRELSLVFLAAGGIGIAPLVELMARLRESNPSAAMRLFYGARTAEEMIPTDAMEVLGVAVHRSTDDGSAGYHGWVGELMKTTAETEGLKPEILFTCGPLPMQRHIAKWALEKGVPAQLSLESLMACGLGACLGCALPATAVPGSAPSAEDHYLHVCKDGPIFPAGAIEWQKMQIHQTQPRIFPYS